MITGDNPLTACYVAKELGIAPGKRLILTRLPPLSASNTVTDSEANIWKWQNVNATTSVVFSAARDEISRLGNAYNLCLTGEVMECPVVVKYFLQHQTPFPFVLTFFLLKGITHLRNLGVFHVVLPFVKVFARVSPGQKVLL